MNIESLIISNNLNENAFEAVAKCHKNAFPKQFLSRLGIEVLKEFYKLHYINGEIILVAEVNNSIIGFVQGGNQSYISQFRKRVLKKNPFLFFRSLFSKEVMISGRNYLKKYIEPKTINKNIPSDYYYLSVIAVDSNFRGKMVAENLLKAFELKCFEQSFKGYYLNVSNDNSRAITFYKKQEMKIFTTDNNSTVMIKAFKEQ